MAYQHEVLNRPEAAAAESPAQDTLPVRPGDRETVKAALAVLEGKSKKPLLARLAPFLGPAFVACVAYIDPGNFATNIQGGARYGYTLLWVILASNLMAMFVQSLSAKLGIATGRNLAELCRQHLPRPAVWGMWGLMEIVAMATDLAEFMGAALGFHLLLGVSLLLGAVFAAVVTLAALALERYGFRPLEALIGAMVAVVAMAYVIETLLDVPDWAQIGYHAVVPAFSGTGSVLVSVGILGATVMPHVIFLHSGLTQGRVVTKDHRQLRRLYRFELIDVVLAMGVAGLVNGAMLIMAAATFNRSGLVGVG
ncbi:MAG: Nramp family divalent metal transporter, partial [Mycobacterium leprae]